LHFYRYLSKQYAAAAEVYALLGKRPGAAAEDIAAALSNEGMCLLCAQQYRNALRKCEAAVLLATDMQKLPKDAWVVAWLQGNLDQQAPQQSTSNESHTAEAAAEDEIQDDACDRYSDCNTKDSSVEVNEASAKKLKQANLVVKSLGRMASCMAHLKDFGAAEKLYREAAEGAKSLGLDTEAEVFIADAVHMEELFRMEADAGKEAVVDASGSTNTAQESIAGG
jgi:hypothetical protein